MIITSSCPLRISLVGGSTDHPLFLDKYKSGSVISFASDLRTYTTIHRDIFGANSIGKKYVLNYSKREEVNDINHIKNELIRHCFKELNVPFVNIFLTSDVFSNGSGLASSSSYVMSIVKTIYEMNNEKITENDICKISLKIEKNFNPLVGQQDFWGSIGRLKKINFYNDSDPTIEYLNPQIFKDLSMHLIFTGIYRSSTNILETIDIDKSKRLLDDVSNLEKAINTNNSSLFHNTIKMTWYNKKQTSKLICENPYIQELDNMIENDSSILSHKLLGAGNGGYFLVFSKKNVNLSRYKNIYNVNISNDGIKTKKM